MSATDHIRSILSENFGTVLECLWPMAFIDASGMKREDDYLNKLASAATMSKTRTQKLATKLIGKLARCSFEIDHKKTHKGIFVDFTGAQKPCEIGDILIISKFVDNRGVLSRHVSLLQAKADHKQMPQTWDIDPTQMMLYKNWPFITCCYTHTFGSTRHTLLQNFRITHSNRLFSPYLLVMRGCVHSWVTSIDLISSACMKSNTIHGPLELSFLSLLIQLLFQTAGEQDIFANNSTNPTLTSLVDTILHHAKEHDPPEGEGRPFLVIKLTVRGEFG